MCTYYNVGVHTTLGTHLAASRLVFQRSLDDDFPTGMSLLLLLLVYLGHDLGVTHTHHLCQLCVDGYVVANLVDNGLCPYMVTHILLA